MIQEDENTHRLELLKPDNILNEVQLKFFTKGI